MLILALIYQTSMETSADSGVKKKKIIRVRVWFMKHAYVANFQRTREQVLINVATENNSPLNNRSFKCHYSWFSIASPLDFAAQRNVEAKLFWKHIKNKREKINKNMLFGNLKSVIRGSQETACLEENHYWSTDMYHHLSNIAYTG